MGTNTEARASRALPAGLAVLFAAVGAVGVCLTARALAFAVGWNGVAVVAVAVALVVIAAVGVGISRGQRRGTTRGESSSSCAE